MPEAAKQPNSIMLCGPPLCLSVVIEGLSLPLANRGIIHVPKQLKFGLIRLKEHTSKTHLHVSNVHGQTLVWVCVIV